MATITGLGVVWGISSTENSFGSGTAKINGQTFRRAAKEDAFMDRNGETVGLSFFDRTKELELTVYPSGTTLALAVACNILMPQPGDAFTVVDSADSQVAGIYIVKEASKDKRSDSKVTWTLKLTVYSTDISATIS